MTDTPRETILANIRERMAKAGGPWRLTRRYPMMIGHGIALQRAREIQHEAETGQVFGLYIGRAHDLPLDAFEFIAHAPDDIRTLLAECDTLRAQLAAETWRCFHCGEVFTTRGGAQDHFGRDESAEPGCLIDRVALETGGTAERGRGLLMALRKAEDEIAALRLENEKLENDSRAWYESEADRVRRIGHVQWWQELDSREGERLVLQERAEQLTAQLAAREGEIATLKEGWAIEREDATQWMNEEAKERKRADTAEAQLAELKANCPNCGQRLRPLCTHLNPLEGYVCKSPAEIRAEQAEAQLAALREEHDAAEAQLRAQEARRIAAYQQARIFEPNMDIYNAVMSVYIAGFVDAPLTAPPITNQNLRL